jgi:uncharacterized protein (DUF488 family)
LLAHGVSHLVDIRRWPTSRRHPHFCRGHLSWALPAAGIGYWHLPELGGRRGPPHPHSPNTGWTSPGFRAYADHMLTSEFRAGMRALQALAQAHPTAIMCAEATYRRCHRMLVADYLALHGWEVRHILDARRWQPHRLTPFARREGEDVLYPALLPG